MKKINTAIIEKKIYEAALEANFALRKDVFDALRKALRRETRLLARNMLKILIDNAKIAKSEKLAICQDTGMAVVFCEIGNDVQIAGDINKAINKGIENAYKKGSLRKSVVADPLIRKNTNTNTPAVIHYEFVSGEKIQISVMPKGFGSENSSFIQLFNPTVSVEKIEKFIVENTKQAAPNACPPVILGIGSGGTLDKACSLAKEALLRPINKNNPKRHIARLERAILKKINKTNIGPMGIGGKTTCLGVNILTYPTHIAGLPVCVNVSCHALRSASVVI